MFGCLPKLQELDLGINNLEGILPEGIGNMTMLRILYLDDNRIKGKKESSWMQ
ncbi:hypothetical protein Goshw_000591 [Gossypium schwendimanii]|uniref:Uncharacterized protein n=1 Tax=Gossypium schwendimanii TaxID=34291 RepID=A0A7J9N4D8_GOSSC|nr:hypothetical protein [Gossypium schwendimanii]